MTAKAFCQVFRDTLYELTHGRFPLALLLIAVPLVFTFLFGKVYEANVVNDVPLVVYDQDQSSLSRQLIEAYDDSDRFTVVSYVSTEEDMKARLNGGEALAALEIPRDFSQEVRSGQSQDVMLMVNSANNMFSSSALNASREISRTFSIAVGQRLLEGLNLLPDEAMNAAYPVHLGVRIIGNPTTGYTSFMLGGLMMHGMQIGMMITFSTVLVTELKRKKYPHCPAPVFLCASALAYMGFALIGYTLSLVLLTTCFAVPFRGSLLSAFAVALAFLTFLAGVLALFSVCSPTRELSLQAPMLYIMPATLYGGLSWPDFTMNTVAWAYARLMPMTYGSVTLRDIMLIGYAPDLYQNIAIMVAAGIGTGTLACMIFALRRRHSLKKAGELSQ